MKAPAPKKNIRQKIFVEERLGGLVRFISGLVS
jgi:hypothetical protein